MFQVTRLEDGIIELPPDDFIYVGDEAEGARIRAAKAGATTPIPVNCFLLRGGGEVILIDSGTGTAWGPGLGHARAALAAEGVPPEAVDRILLTHVHGDHALGLFDDEAAAYFPRARISVPAAELDFLTDPAARAAAADWRRSVFDIADLLFRFYGDRIDRFTAETVLPGIVAVPLPGHTLGHTGYRLETPEGGVLLWGDAAHLAEAQPSDPRVALIYDADADIALKSRHAAFDLALREGLRVGGGHLPGLFRVLHAGDAYRLE